MTCAGTTGKDPTHQSLNPKITPEALDPNPKACALTCGGTTGQARCALFYRNVRWDHGRSLAL